MFSMETKVECCSLAWMCRPVVAAGGFRAGLTALQTVQWDDGTARWSVTRPGAP